jgi:hypothetical protein
MHCDRGDYFVTYGFALFSKADWNNDRFNNKFILLCQGYCCMNLTWVELRSKWVCRYFGCVWMCSVRQAASHFLKQRNLFCGLLFFSVLCERSCKLEKDFSLFVFVNIISIFVSATGHCCVLSCFSHPRGTLTSRIGVAQTANGVTRVRAPGLTPIAAPVWMEVRPCGLRPQGYGRNISQKNSGTPPGIDPGTVRLVAQRLNHYAIPGPKFSTYNLVNCNGLKKHLNQVCNKNQQNAHFFFR